jgi:hypothetical protein
VLSELEELGDRFVVVLDDLHELSSPEAGRQHYGKVCPECR